MQRRTTVRVHQAVWPPQSVEIHFLLGLYRSGTTPLRYSVGMHPNVAAPPESDFLVPFLQSLEDSRSARGLNSMGFDHGHLEATYRQVAGYFFGTYAASLGTMHNVVLDKTPRYVEHAASLLRLFPEARFLILVRHPFGQIGSATKYLTTVPRVPDFPASHGDLAATAATYWQDRTQSLLNVLADAGGRALLVRYEDLCAEPQVELDRIVAHLGLSATNNLVEYDGRQFDRGLEGAKALSHSQFEASMASPIRGWKAADNACLEQIWTVVGDLAVSLGYDRRDLDSPAFQAST